MAGSWILCNFTCVTLSVTLCVRSLTLGAMMVFSEDGGDGHFFSLLASEKLSVIRGILFMVLYLLRLESEVEPSRLDLIWLSGPERESKREDVIIKGCSSLDCGWAVVANIIGACESWTPENSVVFFWLLWHGWWVWSGLYLLKWIQPQQWEYNT